MELIQQGLNLAKELLTYFGKLKESGVLDIILNFVKSINLDEITKLLQSIIGVLPL